MSTWLFDLGNTRLKYAPLQPDGQLGEVRARVHDEAGVWLEALPTGEVACVASVASAAREQALWLALSERFVRMHRVVTEAELGPLRIAYADPRRLGVDRCLAMLGVWDAEPALVVGVGTALTVDLVDADGQHRGGRIAPAPDLMREALHTRAERLPAEGGTYVPFADDTIDALASGCMGAALGLIERSAQEAAALLGRRPLLHLHGGGAQALRAWLGEHVWVPEAVLRGLARWHALRIA